MKIAPALFTALLITGPAALAGTPLSSSGPKQIALIELYSSESCSSCPPADDWVSNLISRPGLFKEFVPVVFHVTYWNHLNWKDGYSSEPMTQRQKDLVSAWREPSLYTPAVIVNGAEFKWRGGELPQATAEPGIELSLVKEGELDFSATAKLSGTTGKFLVRIALLGMGLETKVTSGENGGHNLKHNFIVLDWKSQDLPVTKTVRIKFDKPKQAAARMAVVAWIEKQGNPAPVQSTGAYL